MQSLRKSASLLSRALQGVVPASSIHEPGIKGIFVNVCKHQYRGRWISCVSTLKMSAVAATTSEPPTQASLNYFEELLPSLIHDVTRSTRHARDAPDIMEWVEKVLLYNCAGGKKNRGMSTVSAYEMLERPENITPDSMRLAAILGWCVELLQSFLLILDDVMDGSEFRRGALCWYRRPNVGLAAINDALLVQGCLHAILRKYFRDAPCYADLLDTFNEIVFQTSMGQHLDCSTAGRDGRADLSKFTAERYAAIVRYKTAYYSYVLPVRLALYVAGRRDASVHAHAERICLRIGHFFQVQDDYLDCFGSPAEIGKDGTDIKEGKCCWPAVAALQRCTREQRRVMEAHYGGKEARDALAVRDLYERLGLRDLYAAHERDTYAAIREDVAHLPPDLPPKLFVKMLDKIYKRTS